MCLQGYVCGFDEVGRGAIAGPVVVASVVFYNYSNIPNGIRDSKKINSAKRYDFTIKLEKLLVLA